MTVRTYRGTNQSELLGKIQQDLGPDAVILSTEELDGAIQIRASMDSNQGASSHISRSKSHGDLSSEAIEVEIVEALTRHGVSGDLVQRLLPRLSRIQNQGTRGYTLDKILSNVLSSTFTFDSTLLEQKRVVALCGPTGSGKTTTIAKLAAQMRSAFDLSIGLISADSYRVGAGYHLQSYANLLNLPFRTVDPSHSFSQGVRQAVDAMKRCDLIFIDCAGYSPKDVRRVEGLCDELAQLSFVEKLLVLPAPGNLVDLQRYGNTFSKADIARVVISKIDESGHIGPCLSAIDTLRKPISFITNGQRVPEDIEPASARRLAWMLLQRVH